MRSAAQGLVYRHFLILWFFETRRLDQKYKKETSAICKEVWRTNRNVPTSLDEIRRIFKFKCKWMRTLYQNLSERMRIDIEWHGHVGSNLMWAYNYSRGDTLSIHSRSTATAAKVTCWDGWASAWPVISCNIAGHPGPFYSTLGHVPTSTKETSVCWVTLWWTNIAIENGHL